MVRLRIVKNGSIQLEYMIGKKAIETSADGSCFIKHEGQKLTVTPSNPSTSIYTATIQAASNMDSIDEAFAQHIEAEKALRENLAANLPGLFSPSV